MKPKSFSVMLLLVLILTSKNVNSQILDLLTYPFIKTYPTFNLTSQNDGMGLLEFTRIDPLRDGFINPAKLDLVKTNVGFISATNVLLSNNSYYSSQDGNSSRSDTKNMSTYFWTTPVGGIYRLSSLIIGGTINYQGNGSNYEYIQESDPGNYNSKNKSKFRSTGYPMQLVAAYSFTENIALGLGLDYYKINKSSDYNSVSTSSYGSSSTFSSALKIISDGLFYRGGFKISFDEFNTVYILAMNYKKTEKHKDDPPQEIYSEMESTEKGWLAQVDYSHIMSESLTLSTRFTLDLKKLDETEGTGIQVGFGGNYALPNVSIAGEFIYEPAWLKYEYEPIPPYQLYTSESKYFLNNWRIRIGTEVKLMEELFWRAGFEYSKFRCEYEYSSGNSNNEQTENPLISTGISNLTTGLQMDIGNFQIIYNFLLRNQVFFNYYTSYYGTTSLMLYSPISNRLNIIYKF